MTNITYCINTDCPFKKCERHQHHLKKIKDKSQMVSIADFGGTCSPCFRYTFEDAEEVVKNNMCDIWETCYNYAVIHEIGPELYPHYHSKTYYKYNREINGYEPIEEPECLKHMDFCGIG